MSKREGGFGRNVFFDWTVVVVVVVVFLAVGFLLSSGRVESGEGEKERERSKDVRM